MLIKVVAALAQLAVTRVISSRFRMVLAVPLAQRTASSPNWARPLALRLLARATAKVTIKHKDKTEVEEMTEPAELWISGRDDDNGDVKLVLKIEEDSQAKLVEWLNKPAGEEVELVFKARLPKADMDKLNAKECTNTLVL